MYVSFPLNYKGVKGLQVCGCEPFIVAGEGRRGTGSRQLAPTAPPGPDTPMSGTQATVCGVIQEKVDTRAPPLGSSWGPPGVGSSCLVRWAISRSGAELSVLLGCPSTNPVAFPGFPDICGCILLYCPRREIDKLCIKSQIVSILGFVDHRSVLRLLNSAKLKRRTQNLNSLRHTYVNEWGVNTNRKECGFVTVETHLQTQGRASSTWGSWVADPWPRRMPVTLHVLTFSSEKCGHCTYNIILS